MSAPAQPLSLLAQYVAYLLPKIPPAALANPGSRATRTALRDAASSTVPALYPSRRELAAALLELERMGLMPTLSARADARALLLDGVDR